MARAGKIRFRDSVAEFERLQAEIAAGRFAPLYLLMGEEGYFIDALEAQIAAHALDEASRAFNQTVVYGKESDAGAVITLARQLPMMGDRQLVIVREAQSLRQLERLALYTERPNPATVLVLCHKERAADRRLQLCKQVARSGVLFESVRPRDYEIASWLESFIARRGCTADAKSVGMLIDHLGTDLARIVHELDKLFLAIEAGTHELTPELIERHVGISKEFNTYELTRAVASRNEARALAIAEHFARNPKEHPLPLSIMALFMQFRELFVIVFTAWECRSRRESMPPDAELLKRVHLPNPYLLGELKETARKWSTRQLFGVLELLRTYDARSKGVAAGGLSDSELLRELLLKIFALR